MKYYDVSAAKITSQFLINVCNVAVHGRDVVHVPHYP